MSSYAKSLSTPSKPSAESATPAGVPMTASGRNLMRLSLAYVPDELLERDSDRLHGMIGMAGVCQFASRAEARPTSDPIDRITHHRDHFEGVSLPPCLP